MVKWMLIVALLLCIVAPVAAQDATATPEMTPEATLVPADLPDVVRSVYDRLIEQPGLAAEVITPIAVEKVEFPDGCLGAPSADEMCAMMVTEGYRSTFATPYGTFEIRTSLSGDNFRFAAPLALPANTLPALMYEVSGGFAGICYQLVVGADSTYALVGCRGDQTVISTGTLPDEYKSVLAEALTKYAPFKWPTVIVPPVPDQFVSSYVFNGTGSEKIDEQTASMLDGHVMTLINQLAAAVTPTPAPANEFAACSATPEPTPCPTIAR